MTEHGTNFKIGKYNFIEPDVTIGDNVTIGSYVIIKRGTKIGNNSIIGDYCKVGYCNKIGNGVILQGNIRTSNGCIIKNHVTIKWGVILTSEVVVHENAFIGPHAITLGSTHKRETRHGTSIGVNCFIGAGTIIMANTKISPNITTGANSYVNKDLTKPGIYVGTPARWLKDD
jgi:acetyltransferase-like isoleucine patch superfamily enzyme